jgi:precorrin-6B methylase 2
VARQGNFQADIYLGRNPNDWEDNSRIFMGNGVDDYNRLINIIAAGTYPGARLLMDVNAPEIVTQAPQWRQFTIADLLNIRAVYISLWGTVNKPRYYTGEPAVDIPLQTTITVDPTINGNG